LDRRLVSEQSFGEVSLDQSKELKFGTNKTPLT